MSSSVSRGISNKRGVHDMGGEPAGPVDTHEHTPTLTERRIDAMMQLLRAQPNAFWRTDENRRTIEALAPQTYKDSGYYEKWAYAMRGLLVEKGVVTEAEVAKRLAEVKARFKTSGKAKPAAKAAKPKTDKPATKSAPAAKSAAKPKPAAKGKAGRAKGSKA